MQRLIRSFNTLTDPLKDLLQEQFPDGIDATHIKSVPTAKGEMLRVIELKTAEAIYLIKINPESRQEIEEFLDQDDDGDPDDISSDDDDMDTDIEGADDDDEDDTDDDPADTDDDEDDDDED